MFVLCILTVKSKVKKQDNQDKERSTNEVQSTKESKKNTSRSMDVSVVCCGGLVIVVVVVNIVRVP